MRLTRQGARDNIRRRERKVPAIHSTERGGGKEMPLYPSNKVPLKKMRGKECRWNLHVENKCDSSAGAVLGVLLRRPLIDTPPPHPPSRKDLESGRAQMSNIPSTFTPQSLRIVVVCLSQCSSPLLYPSPASQSTLPDPQLRFCFLPRGISLSVPRTPIARELHSTRSLLFVLVIFTHLSSCVWTWRFIKKNT